MPTPACFEEFCDAVCRRVRYPFARFGIREELTAHLEDRAAALMDEGVEEREAQARAVAAMGDPVALGRELDRVHHPLWGWLSLASGLLALLMVGMLLCSPLWGVLSHTWRSYQERGEHYEDATPHVYWPLDRETRFDGRVVHWTGAYLARLDAGRPPRVTLDFDYRSENPFLEVSPLPEEGFSIVDDLGNDYSYSLHRGYAARYGSSLLDGYTVLTQDLTILDVDPRAEWVRVTYDYCGRSFTETFRLEWEGLSS